MPRQTPTLTILAALTALVLARPASPAIRWSAGLQAGFNEGMATYEWAGSTFDLHPRFTSAWSAGATLDVPFGRRLSLVTGARYVEYGDRMDVTFVYPGPTPDPSAPPTVTFRNHTTWRYVSVPALLRFRPLSTRGLFVEAGAEGGCLLDVGLSVSVDGFAPFDLVAPRASASPDRRSRVRPAAAIFEQVGTFDAMRPYRRWNLSLAGGAGWEFPWRGHTALVEARYTHGLADIAKSPELTRRTRGMELLAGWRW